MAIVGVALGASSAAAVSVAVTLSAPQQAASVIVPIPAPDADRPGDLQAPDGLGVLSDPCPYLTRADVEPLLGDGIKGFAGRGHCLMWSLEGELWAFDLGPAYRPAGPCSPLYGWAIGSRFTGCLDYPFGSEVVWARLDERGSTVSVRFWQMGLTRQQMADLTATVARRAESSRRSAAARVVQASTSST